MVENLRIVSTLTQESVVTEQHKPKITIFHCFNINENLADLDNINYDITRIQMPCSSITKELFLLRAFESGADAVIVIVCPPGSCHYIEGNIRAGKRVARMKKLLDEIGLDSRRLNIYFSPQGTKTALSAINQTLAYVASHEPDVLSQI